MRTMKNLFEDTKSFFRNRLENWLEATPPTNSIIEAGDYRSSIVSYSFDDLMKRAEQLIQEALAGFSTDLFVDYGLRQQFLNSPTGKAWTYPSFEFEETGEVIFQSPSKAANIPGYSNARFTDRNAIDIDGIQDRDAEKRFPLSETFRSSETLSEIGLGGSGKNIPHGWALYEMLKDSTRVPPGNEANQVPFIPEPIGRFDLN